MTVERTVREYGPQRVDINMPRGQDQSIELIVKDSDGDVIDISGNSFTMNVLTEPGGVVVFTEDGDVTVGTDGKVIFVIDPEQIEVADTMDVTVWYYAVVRTADGQTTITHEGDFSVQPSVP